MANYLIITEKPSAAQNFVKALGGKVGSFEGNNFNITNLRGHVMTLKEPEEMVAPDLQKAYKSWTLKYMPWNLADFKWQRTYIRSRNLRTGKSESSKNYLMN